MSVSPGSSHTFSFLSLSQVLISVAAATQQFPPLMPPPSSLLAACLKVAELVNNCVFIYIFLPVGFLLGVGEKNGFT